MYGFFYPENNQRFLASVSFDTVQECVVYFRDKRAMWEEIEARDQNKAAFMNPITGDIVVVREIAAL